MNDLIIVEKFDVAVVFTPDGMAGILQDIETQVLAHVPNVQDENGRKDITSLAHQVARSKTLIDKAGKTLTAEWKKKAKNIDNHRKTARDFLDELKIKVRLPLSDWEVEQQLIKDAEEEKERIKIENRVTALSEYQVILPFIEIAAMTDEEFEGVLSKEKAAHEEQQAKLAEEARLEKERLEKEEAERQAEAIRLAKQKADQDAEAERLEKQKAELEAEAKAIQDEKDRITKAEADKKAAEKAKIQSEADAKAEAEVEAKEAEENAIRATEEAKRQEALKPTKDRIYDYADDILKETPPMFKDPGAATLIQWAISELQTLSDCIKMKADDL